MEEPKPPPPAPPQGENKKRKADDIGDFQNSSYFKIRTIVKDLRPFFVQHKSLTVKIKPLAFSKGCLKNKPLVGCINGTPLPIHFAGMKVMIELTKQLRTDSSPPNPKKQEQTVLGIKAEHSGKLQEEERLKASELNARANISDEIAKLSKFVNQQDGLRGTFMVGGSPIGWNFVVFSGGEPVYYGRTKESAIALRAAKQSAKESEEAA